MTLSTEFPDFPKFLAHNTFNVVERATTGEQPVVPPDVFMTTPPPLETNE